MLRSPGSRISPGVQKAEDRVTSGHAHSFGTVFATPCSDTVRRLRRLSTHSPSRTVWASSLSALPGRGKSTVVNAVLSRLDSGLSTTRLSGGECSVEEPPDLRDLPLPRRYRHRPRSGSFIVGARQPLRAASGRSRISRRRQHRSRRRSFPGRARATGGRASGQNRHHRLQSISSPACGWSEGSPQSTWTASTRRTRLR